jgi:quercetin dioxygenase-like cupin family protein
MILGALALLFCAGGGGGVAHTAHLGGLVSGLTCYLKRPRLNLFSEIQYRVISSGGSIATRRKFDVYSGGPSRRHQPAGPLANVDHSMTVPVHRWMKSALEKITEMISRKIVTGEREMLAQTYLKRGAQVPMHTHESEQMTYVLQGALRFVVDGEEIIVKEGEVLHIPSGTAPPGRSARRYLRARCFQSDSYRLARSRAGAII